MVSKLFKKLFSKKITQDNIEEFMDKAEELLDDEKYEDAIELGHKIAKVYSGGTEIIARSYVDQGDTLKAVEVLEDALVARPQIWALWSRLGSLYSDTDQFEKAHIAYDKALACDNCDTDLINLNISIVYLRQGDHAKAESSLDINQNPYTLKTLGMLLDLYLRSDQMNKAQELVDSLKLNQLDKDIETSDYNTNSDLARVYYDIGNFYRLTDNKSSAIEFAIKSLKSKINDNALWLIRETRLTTSNSTKYFAVTIKGTNHRVGSSEAAGFYRNLEIVADTKKEALSFAQEIEIYKDQFTISLDEAEIKIEEYDQPKGVYWMSGCVFYEND